LKDLDGARIEIELAQRGVALGRPLVVLDITTSTNDDAKRAAQEGAPDGAAFVADAQTRGRGRLGRSWHSPAGENLYASFVLRPSWGPKVAPLGTLAAGLAVADAIASRVPRARVGLKWPNDVLVDDRKVSGILSEAQLAGGDAWIVVGIGVNVGARTFPPELAEIATSLALSGAMSLDRGALFVDIASALSLRVAALRAGDPAPLVESFAARDALAGRRITVDGAPATALGIAANGSLCVRRPDGRETTCLAGDVRLAR